MIELVQVPKTEPRLRADMGDHYSEPKGFVGRSICYAIHCDGWYWGSIVGGSAVRHLPGRAAFFGEVDHQRIINNVFFHLRRRSDGKYPRRNFARSVLGQWRARCGQDWWMKYGESPVGFESLVELPRTGEVYLRDGWTEVGLTKGFTCKRTAGKGTDSWTGKRVWNTTDLRPKRVFARLLN